MSLLFELVAVGVLILLNAFFVAAEYGLVTARRTRIIELHHAGNRRARDVLRITADPPRFIAAMQLGVTLTSLGIGALGEQALANAFGDFLATVLAVLIAYLILTFLHVVIGELVPKGIALGHAEGTALFVSAPVRGFFIVFRPLIWFLEAATEIVLRWLGLQPPGAEDQVLSEAELRMLVSQSTRGGEIEQQEQEMLYKVFDFADKEASDVMVPRPEVVALSVDLPPEQCLEAVMDSPYTRYPVYRETLDNVVGILHVRDLFSALRERGMHEVRVEELVRPAHIVPETKDLAALLTEFRRTNQHMAIVVDEYGELEGIVTLEDLLEESVERLPDGRMRIDGTFPIDDFNEQFHRDLPIEDYHTVGGFVFGLLGRAPERGDEVEHDGTRFKVLDVEGSRIERLEVELVPHDTEGEQLKEVS